MVRIVLVTCPPDRANEIASHLLSQRVCACISVVPAVESRYWWEGSLETAQESLLIIKCDGELVDTVVEKVKEVHPYEVPEVLAVAVEGGNLDYLDWVRSAARAGSGGAGDKSAPPFATREEVTEALSAPPARSGERGAAMAAAGAVPVARAAGSGGLAPSESFKKLLTSLPPPAAEVHERVGNMKIALLGPPGVGKGTQAKLLSARYGLKHVSAGDIILKAVRGGTAFGQRAREFTQAGKLVPDEEVVALVRQYLSALGGGGCVLDGFPRTLAQAQALADDQPDLVFYLNAPQEVLIDRLTKRNYCDCGAAYGPGRAPLRAGVCDECGGKLYQREDDQPRHVLTRLDEYNSKTRELLRFYRDRLRPVDGSLLPGEVFKQLCKLLEKTS